MYAKFAVDKENKVRQAHMCGKKNTPTKETPHHIIDDVLLNAAINLLLSMRQERNKVERNKVKRSKVERSWMHGAPHHPGETTRRRKRGPCVCHADKPACAVREVCVDAQPGLSRRTAQWMVRFFRNQTEFFESSIVFAWMRKAGSSRELVRWEPRKMFQHGTAEQAFSS